MRVGRIADETGANVHTLRYSSAGGYFQASARQGSGVRDNPADTIRLIRLVRRAQELGFTLSEVESLLRLAAGAPGDVGRQLVCRGWSPENPPRALTYLESFSRGHKRDPLPP